MHTQGVLFIFRIPPQHNGQTNSQSLCLVDAQAASRLAKQNAQKQQKCIYVLVWMCMSAVLAV